MAVLAAILRTVPNHAAIPATVILSLNLMPCSVACLDAHSAVSAIYTIAARERCAPRLNTLSFTTLTPIWLSVWR